MHQKHPQFHSLPFVSLPCPGVPPLGELIALPRPSSWIWGGDPRTAKGHRGKGGEVEGRKGRRGRTKRQGSIRERLFPLPALKPTLW